MINSFNYADKNNLILVRNLNTITHDLQIKISEIKESNYPPIFLTWLMLKNIESRDNEVIKYIKISSKEVSLMNDNGSIPSVLYFYTWLDHVIYVGSTKLSFKERYDRFPKTPLFQSFCDLLDPGQLSQIRVFVKHVPPENLRVAEYRTINYLCSHKIPTCNKKCENITDYRKQLAQYEQLQLQL